CVVSFVFFFFQAEDGIRDRNVTGVQTCALPIFERPEAAPPRSAMTRASLNDRREPAAERMFVRIATCMPMNPDSAEKVAPSAKRSEERRVGKECRARGWACR